MIARLWSNYRHRYRCFPPSPTVLHVRDNRTLPPSPGRGDLFFITREDNSIFGIYTTDELGDVYEGVFFKGKLKRKTLTIITTDEHMQGELILKFSDNFNEFHGWWVGDNGSSQGSWEGKAGDFCVE